MTGSPIARPVTPGPSASTTPVPSTPRRAWGRGTAPGDVPERIIWSSGLTAIASILTRSSPAPGSSTGSSTTCMTSGPPNSSNTTTRGMVTPPLPCCLVARGRRYGAVGYLLVPSISMENAAGPVFLADCPTRLAVEVISDKWAVLVIFGLSRRPRRHGELVDLIGGISRKVLTQTLRRLQGYGLVERRAEAPRRVEYGLTALRRTLIAPIEVLTNWARDPGEAIADFQEAAEAATPARTHAAGCPPGRLPPVSPGAGAGSP